MKHKLEIINDDKKPFFKKKINLSWGRCSICLENIKKCKSAHFLPCCHYFHKECVETWLENNVTCPECRIPIFIQDHDQYDDYQLFNADQKNDQDLIRQNLQISDNAIAMRFIQDEDLFDMELVEQVDILKFQAIIETVEPSLEELYAHFDDSDSDISNADAIIITTRTIVIRRRTVSDIIVMS